MGALMEIWKDVEGHNLYEINNFGEIRNKKTGKILKQTISNSGYCRVVLNSKPFSVHRLVATAFIPNPQNKPCVNHIDNNKTNNSLENLEWVTHKENMEWASIQGRMKPGEELLKRYSEIHKDKRSVIGTDKRGNKYYFESMTDVRNVGFLPNKISLCCRGMRKSAYNMFWEFAEGNNNNAINYSSIPLDMWEEIRKKPISKTKEYDREYYLRVRKQKEKQKNGRVV